MRNFWIDEINKTVNFSFPYDEDLKNDVKNLTYDSRWNAELKIWVVPINGYTKDKILPFIRKYNFHKKEVVTKDVDFSYEKCDVDYAYLKGLCDSKGFSYIPRKYQLEALGYALEKGNLINGDDVGLGKTFESIIYAEVKNKFPCLVITPSSVKYNWYEKWTEIVNNPNRTISVIESSKKNDWDADVVIINYDIIGKKQGTGTKVNFPELVEKEWKMVICDEAHFLKEKKSQRSQAAKKILNKDDLTVQFLTGTAIMSKPIEIWNLLCLIGKQKLIALDWMQFVTRYCGGYKGKFGWVTDGATNILELNRKLRENCYIRREKKNVLKELPKVIKQVIHIPITNQKKIDKANEDFIEYILQNKGEEAADKAMEAEHLVALSELRKLAVQGKIKAIEQYIKDWKTSSNQKLLIFGIHKEPLEKLSSKFKSPLISGGINSKKKQDIVKSWVEGGDQFLFANIESAGTGVDGLQKVCSNMIIIELPWRTSDIEQVIGRLDRSGQTDTPYINFLLNDNTIDKEMWEMLENKERVTEAVNKGIDVKRNGTGMKQVVKKMLKRLR